MSFLGILRLDCALDGNFYLRRIGRAVSPCDFSSAYALMTIHLSTQRISSLSRVIFLRWLLGIEKIIERIVRFSLFCSLRDYAFNFSMGFMICHFAVLYFFTVLKKYEFHRFRCKGRSFIYFGSLLSAGIAAIVLIPVYLQITSGPKYLDTSKMNLSGNFKLFDLISKNYTGAYDLEEYKYGLPSIYCGAIVTVFMILFFLNHKIRVKKKGWPFAYL